MAIDRIYLDSFAVEIVLIEEDGTSVPIPRNRKAELAAIKAAMAQLGRIDRDLYRAYRVCSVRPYIPSKIARFYWRLDISVIDSIFAAGDDTIRLYESIAKVMWQEKAAELALLATKHGVVLPENKTWRYYERCLNLIKEFGDEAKLYISANKALLLPEAQLIHKYFLNDFVSFRKYADVEAAYLMAKNKFICDRFNVEYEQIEKVIGELINMLDEHVDELSIAFYEKDVIEAFKKRFNYVPKIYKFFVAHDYKEFVDAFDQKTASMAVREFGMNSIAAMLAVVPSDVYNMMNVVDKLHTSVFIYKRQFREALEYKFSGKVSFPENLDIYECWCEAFSALRYNNAEKASKFLKDLYLKYEILRFERITGKKLSDMPDKKIKILDHKGKYSVRMLSKDDPIALALGEITHCCQHLNGAGKYCVLAGYMLDNSGFIVFEKDKAIVAQAWVWEAKNGCLVLDNIETANGQPFDAIIPDLKCWASKQDYDTILLGKGWSKVGNENWPTYEGSIVDFYNGEKSLCGELLYTDAKSAWYIKKDGKVVI